jgi:hypothetical protein
MQSVRAFFIVGSLFRQQLAREAENTFIRETRLQLARYP